jgi:hypothetical protein
MWIDYDYDYDYEHEQGHELQGRAPSVRDGPRGLSATTYRFRTIELALRKGIVARAPRASDQKIARVGSRR